MSLQQLRSSGKSSRLAIGLACLLGVLAGIHFGRVGWSVGVELVVSRAGSDYEMLATTLLWALFGGVLGASAGSLIALFFGGTLGRRFYYVFGPALAAVAWIVLFGPLLARYVNVMPLERFGLALLIGVVAVIPARSEHGFGKHARRWAIIGTIIGSLTLTGCFVLSPISFVMSGLGSSMLRANSGSFGLFSLAGFGGWAGAAIGAYLGSMLDRPVPPSHCQRCRYNLTGLTEPRCPECGQPFEPRGDAP